MTYHGKAYSTQPPTPYRGMSVELWSRRLTKWLNANRVMAGPGIIETATAHGKTLAAETPIPFDWCTLSFGATVEDVREEGAEDPVYRVRVCSGYIFRSTEAVLVSETDVTVSGGTEEAPYFVYVRYQHGDLSTAEIVANAVAPDGQGLPPFPNATYWQVPILSAYGDESDGITIDRRLRIGDIYAPAW